MCVGDHEQYHSKPRLLATIGPVVGPESVQKVM